MNSDDDDDDDDDADDDDNDDDYNHAIWPLIIYFGGQTVTLYPRAFALPRKSYGIGLLLRTVKNGCRGAISVTEQS